MRTHRIASPGFFSVGNERTLVSTSHYLDELEKSEAQRYFHLAEQHALLAFGAANADTDLAVKVEAMR